MKQNTVLVKQIKKKNLRSVVQDEIRQHILKTGLKEGMPLPTEKELSLQLGIGRTVLREALNGLEMIGAIEVRQGVGRFVGRVDVESMVKNLIYTLPPSVKYFQDLLEVRIVLETEFILRDLAQYTKEDIAWLYEELNNQRTMIQNKCSEKDLIEAHANFHSRLLYQSDNTLLINLINMFAQIQTTLNWQHHFVSLNRLKYYDDHKLLVDAIASQKPEVVISCLKEHFVEL
ncbi:MAG: GntR family transcriptional regulator [Sphaerochaetaceae bacterium]